MSKTRIEVGDKVTMEMGYSEVCVHLQVSGRVMVVEALSRGAQLYTIEGEKFSFPILHGEAGLYPMPGEPGVWQVETDKVLKLEKASTLGESAGDDDV